MGAVATLTGSAFTTSGRPWPSTRGAAQSLTDHGTDQSHDPQVRLVVSRSSMAPPCVTRQLQGDLPGQVRGVVTHATGSEVQRQLPVDLTGLVSVGNQVLQDPSQVPSLLNRG